MRRQSQTNPLAEIMQLYQLFSPEQQAREELLTLQAMQMRQQAEQQAAMAPLQMEMLQAQLASEQAQQQQREQMMPLNQEQHQAQLELHRAQAQIYADQHAQNQAVLTNPSPRDDQKELANAATLMQLSSQPHAKQHALLQTLPPAMRANVLQGMPWANVSPKELSDLQRKVGPIGPDAASYKPEGGNPFDKPVEVGRALTDFMQAHPELHNEAFTDQHAQALKMYQSYMELPSEIDTDSTWLSHAQAAKTPEDLVRIKDQVERRYRLGSWKDYEPMQTSTMPMY